MSRRQRRLLIGSLVTTFLLVIGIVWFLWSWFFGEHDRMLSNFRRQYAHIHHPAGTQRVRYYTNLGLLAGNGNHCDFFVGEVRIFTGSREHLLKQYASQTYWSPLEKERFPVEIIFFRNGKLDDERYYNDIGFTPSPLEHFTWVTKASRIPEEHLYIVYIFDVGYDARGDIRCM